MEENITEVITPEAPQDIPAQTAPVAEPVAQPAASDCQEPAGYPQEEPVSPKPKKKLNKKVLIIGIAAILVVALAVCLVSLLGGGTKNTGVFIKDGELYLYVEGKKEPVELTSRLWKGAENNTLVSMGGVLTNLVTIRNNGQLVFYPDKFENNSDGYTIYVANVNKPKEDPVKIDNSIATYYVSEDGQQVLYAKYNKTYSLHLYDVKNEEETRLAKDIQMFHHFTYAEDLSSVCYLSDEDLYLWTPDSEDVRIAKDVSAFQYLPETGIVFAKTADGELLMKTAQMEECEEVAEDVSTLLGVYASGEAYYLRKSIVERCLLDYLDDDMKTEDAAIAQPKKPNYPSAPKRIYYWNYATDEEYQKAKEQYDIDYAAYLEQYNAMKEEYDKAMELYNLKQERDAIRENLEARTIEYEEYALYYYDGSEEHLISDSLVSGSFKARSRDAAVTVYNAFTPKDLVKPTLSEIEDKWAAFSLIQQAIKESLYTDNDFYLLQGGKSTVINQTAASNFLISSDGSSVFFLDAPFVAYSSKNGSHAEAPVAEAPAAEIPAETLPGEEEEEEEGEALIPESQREYASLYRISITDGEAGEPELVDSEVSLRFTPHIGPDASRLTYAKNADEEDRCGELYVAGQLVSDDAYLNYRLFQEERFLFFTDWDTDDQCGTLCMIKLGDEKAEVIEIADDVHSIATTENGDVFYLQDYSEKRYEGTLFLYDMSKGKAKEIADDVTYLG